MTGDWMFSSPVHDSVSGFLSSAESFIVTFALLLVQLAVKELEMRAVDASVALNQQWTKAASGSDDRNTKTRHLEIQVQAGTLICHLFQLWCSHNTVLAGVCFCNVQQSDSHKSKSKCNPISRISEQMELAQPHFSWFWLNNFTKAIDEPGIGDHWLSGIKHACFRESQRTSDCTRMTLFWTVLVTLLSSLMPFLCCKTSHGKMIPRTPRMKCWPSRKKLNDKKELAFFACSLTLRDDEEMKSSSSMKACDIAMATSGSLVLFSFMQHHRPAQCFSMLQSLTPFECSCLSKDIHASHKNKELCLCKLRLSLSAVCMQCACS